MKFDHIIDETANSRVVGWIDNPNIGWISDADPMRFYYGAPATKVKQILRDGIFASDDGYVLLSAEPHSSLAYAKMRTPLTEDIMFSDEEQSVVFIVEFPRNYLAKRHLLVENDKQSRFTNKELYEEWGKSDVEYYALIEVRVPEYIPVEFIKGYTTK